VTTRKELEDMFVEHLRARWAKGQAEYGDKSFDVPVFNTVQEILQEIEDLAGWSFILWCQVRSRMLGVRIATTDSDFVTNATDNIPMQRLINENRQLHLLVRELGGKTPQPNTQ
jgi:hypothetical protein